MGIVLFDGVCNLCNGAVRFIIKRDRFGKFRFASLQSDTGRALLQQNGVTHWGTDSIVYIPQHGYAFRESSAVLYILKELGRGWQLFFPLIHLPTFLRERNLPFYCPKPLQMVREKRKMHATFGYHPFTLY